MPLSARLEEELSDAVLEVSLFPQANQQLILQAKYCCWQVLARKSHVVTLPAYGPVNAVVLLLIHLYNHSLSLTDGFLQFSQFASTNKFYFHRQPIYSSLTAELCTRHTLHMSV